MRAIDIEIAAAFEPYLDATLLRLRYLQVGWQFARRADLVTVMVPQDVTRETVEREIAYALYRERILSETMDMRRSLLDLVGGR